MPLDGLLMLFIHGQAANFTLDRPSSTWVVTIVTNEPKKIVEALIDKLRRASSCWETTGGYTGGRHYLVSCTIYRSHVAEEKHLAS